MTVTTTPSKRSRARLYATLAALSLLLAPLKAAAQSDGDVLPVLSYVGIIPMEAPASRTPTLTEALSQSGQAFASVMRRSARFFVLHDELVAQLWDSPAGRQELADEYELSAFAHLSAHVSPDTVTLTARLLGPDFEAYLEESITKVRQDFERAPLSDVLAWVEDLGYSLTNRLPIDYTVTSIQGPYVTLSAGMAQGLAVGQTIELKRATIKDRHPALGTWRSFTSLPIGSARLVEVKERASIAKLVDLIEADSVQVGDGARAPTLPGRKFFARQETRPRSAAGRVTDGVLLRRLANQDTTPDTPRMSDLPVPVPPGFAPPPTWKDAEGRELPVVPEGEGDERGYIGKVRGYLAQVSADVEARVGHYGFSYAGPGATGSRMVWYAIANYAEIGMKRELMPRVYYAARGNLAYGKTQEGIGGFQQLGARAELFWQQRFRSGPRILRSWSFGPTGRFSTLAVSGEPFGGYDLLQAGVFASLEGAMGPEERPDAYDVFARLDLTPLSFGRVGYDNKRHSVRSSLAWALSLGAYLNAPDATMNYGAGLDYGYTEIFDDSKEALPLSEFRLLLLARWAY